METLTPFLGVGEQEYWKVKTMGSVFPPNLRFFLK